MSMSPGYFWVMLAVAFIIGAVSGSLRGRRDAETIRDLTEAVELLGDVVAAGGHRFLPGQLRSRVAVWARKWCKP